VDLKFATVCNRVNEDEEIEFLNILMNKKMWIVTFDKTDHPLLNEVDASEPQAISYTNPDLPRTGGSSTRKKRHITWVYGSTASYEIIPPLYVCDSKAKKTDSQKVKANWVDGLPKVRGRYGCPTVEEYSSYVSVRSKSYMDEELFQGYILNVIVSLYPNISQKFEHDVDGNFLRGPVLIKNDGGPGRLTASMGSLDFREKLNNMGANLFLNYQNSTSVAAEMNQLYRTYKASFCTSTEAV